MCKYQPAVGITHACSFMCFTLKSKVHEDLYPLDLPHLKKKGFVAGLMVLGLLLWLKTASQTKPPFHFSHTGHRFITCTCISVLSCTWQRDVLFRCSLASVFRASREKDAGFSSAADRTRCNTVLTLLHTRD